MTQRIIIWPDEGFCPGVDRAMRLIDKALKTYGEVFTLGPLIHNPQVIADLCSRGAKPIDDIDIANGGVLILRTHGVGPKTMRKAERVAKVAIDATCPYVKRAQKAARALTDEGREVLVIGNPKHPEVLALLEWIGTHGHAIETEEDLGLIPDSADVGIVGQTTLERSFFDRVVDEARKKWPPLKVVDTLCPVTRRRQELAIRLSKCCDAVVVVGGKASANTKRLAEIALKERSSVLHIESPKEDALSWCKGRNVIGVIGGASTPQEAVFEAAKCIARLS